jgi:glycosyltransferase involved in cell wall biosynthesis
MRQQARAVREWGIEQGWLNEHQRRQTVKEFDLADRIYVTSRYSHDSFLREGMPEDKLQSRQLVVPSRFRPCKTNSFDGRFRVTYVGSISVVKGIPVLLEAFSRLKNPDAELVLVGGWSTRGMRIYLERWLCLDSRIRVIQGDPLPVLQGASVYVHPSYQDGLGFAPLEALSCGVPVIVSADTGMKEHVVDGVNGYVVPTGKWEAILERLSHLQKHPLPKYSAA